MLSPLPNEVFCTQEPGRLREKGAGRGGGGLYCLASLQRPDTRKPSVLPCTMHFGLFLTFGCVHASPPATMGSDALAHYMKTKI